MRGRKPTPTDLHKLKGTFNATRHGKDRKGEPTADGVLSDAPDWLSPDQRIGWAYAIDHAPAGLLKKIDLAVLTVWVIAEDQHRVSAIQQAKIDANTSLPLLTKDKNGQPVASPYLGVMNRAAIRMLKAGSDLGFSPASRPRLAGGNDTVEDDSPWGQFAVINGGKNQT